MKTRRSFNTLKDTLIKIHKLLARNYTYTEIAEDLGVTKNVIAGLLFRFRHHTSQIQIYLSSYVESSIGENYGRK